MLTEARITDTDRQHGKFKVKLLDLDSEIWVGAVIFMELCKALSKEEVRDLLKTGKLFVADVTEQPPYVILRVMDETQLFKFEIGGK